ncbi:MAG: glycerophosphodiester phosphodiesterase family protein, partial [Akkermansiaceae bacterium]
MPKTNRLHPWLGLLALMASSVLPCLSQPEETASPLVIAHRGASAAAPENTLPAFQLAWQQGADGIEADFLLSKDGHIVCFHDKDTKRITGKKLLVKDATLAELRQLDVGAWKDARYAGTRIPTITEVLATVPEDKKCFIEIKCGAEIVEPLLREIEASTIKRDQITI